MKRKLSFFLAVLLLLAFFNAPISAASSTLDAPDNNIENSVLSLISSILHEKELYGFTDESISDLWIGTMIPAYEAVGNTLSTITNLSYYPILDSYNNLISIAAITTDSTGTKAYLLPDFSEKLNEYIDFSDIVSLALIYDDTKVYYTDGVVINLLITNSEADRVSSRSPLSNIPESAYQNISVNLIVAESFLDIASYVAPCGQSDDWTHVTVGTILQPSDHNWCWAGSMACIVNKELGYSYTCESIAAEYATGPADGKFIDEVQRYFSSGFSLTYSLCTTRNLTNILNSLGNNHPVYSQYTRSENGEVVARHAMVIRGIDFTANSFSVMDPASGSFRTGQISNVSGNNGTLTIVRYNEAQIYTLESYLYM